MSHEVNVENFKSQLELMNLSNDQLREARKELKLAPWNKDISEAMDILIAIKSGELTTNSRNISRKVKLNKSDSMLLGCAKLVKFVLSNNFTELEKKLFAKMLVEGFRKAHDQAESEFGKGKFLGHLYWTKSALELLADNAAIKKSLSDNLRHEHSVPLIYLAENILFKMSKDATELDIFEKIKTFGIVVIMTREEDSKLVPKNKMPDNWDKQDVFARYGKLKSQIIKRV